MQYGKPDKNQSKIVDALRKVGCTVFITSGVGMGFPDLVVGRGGSNYLLEVKTAKGELKESQEEFFALWNGQVQVVRTPEEALEAVGFWVDVEAQDES